MDFEKYMQREICTWLLQRKDLLSDVTLSVNKNMFASVGGQCVESPFFISKGMLALIVDKMCKGSLYANQPKLKDGYINVDGDRVGVVGSVVLDENGNITHMRNITTINIRLSRQILGSADEIMPYIYESGVHNTLIISPPSRGKTTILRDAARQCGNMLRCGIVDERGEIAGGGDGEFVNDIGKFSFVLDCCPKSKGILMMLRSMAPDLIVTDEIGAEDDEDAILRVMNAGVKLICTAHGYDERDILRRSSLRVLSEQRVFERIIVLSDKGEKGKIKKAIKL